MVIEDTAEIGEEIQIGVRMEIQMDGDKITPSDQYN
jgi:hypothetical protein